MTKRPKRLRDPGAALRRARLMPRWVRTMDDRAADWINTGVDDPRVDRGFSRLSRIADRSLLWFAVAGVLTLAGQRRAAVRGILSLVTASMIGNLIGKQVFGGDRPILKDVPVGRRLGKHPTTPSFPSGHSASAAAFATGVALESPAAGALVAPVAAGVAYSRLHTGAHWLSDVLGGTALGMAVAGAGALPRRLVPSHPIGGRGTEISLPALADGAGVLIIANASSGRHVRRRDPLRIIHRRLPRAVVRVLGKGQAPEDVVRAALSGPHPPQVLGVAGGDGTVSALAHLARQVDLPLLVLPAGTFNHFARAVGAVTVDQAIDALQAGAGLSVDVAELTSGDGDPVTVLNAAAVGIYPDFLAERDRFEDRWTKWGASLIAAVRMVRTLRPVTVAIEGRRARLWSLFVSVNRNDPRLVSTMQRRGLDDRVLDVRVLHASGSPIRAVASLIFGRRTSAVLRAVRLMPPRSRIEAFTTPSLDLTVRARGSAIPRFSHDGELERPAPTGAESVLLRVRVIPGGLRVYSLGPESEADRD
ncbi:bifunctional phosphatase PAP2/diacylglycerol kinase family protein [Naasia sp. SYSU D00057]|uniref:bifunctional phosphatase PAP2/diacylglycerol kinase family protein n=1 Tax=Naasia sp. SYSU D00057 TaxID=2817380 RepID=UPI001B310531|nr:bifunctional phosphatase PAP2/diacylglycerol kinase family protein [Naasia sp. SYSU D00057]